MALGFVGMYATGLLPTVLQLPIALIATSPPVALALGAALLLVRLALEVGVAVYAVRRAVDGSAHPPWLAIVLVAVLALFSYPATVGVNALVAAAQSRQVGVAQFAELAMGNAMLATAGGGLHVLLILGILVAVALRWQRSLDAAGE